MPSAKQSYSYDSYLRMFYVFNIYVGLRRKKFQILKTNIINSRISRFLNIVRMRHKRGRFI